MSDKQNGKYGLYTNDEIQDLVSQNEFSLLSVEKSHKKTKIYVIDKYGYKFVYTYKELIKGIKKGKFGKNKEFATYNLKHYIKINFPDIIVDDFNYIDTSTIVSYICKKHSEQGKQTMQAKYIPIRKSLCKYCKHEYLGNCNSLGEDVYRKIIEAYDAEYIGCIYKNNQRFIQFRCFNHYNEIQERKLGNIKRSLNTSSTEGVCRFCNMEKRGRTHRSTHEELINHPNLNPNITILEEYTLWNKPIKCQCKICSHIWYPTPNKLKNGRGCPNCAHHQTSVKQLKSQEKFIQELSLSQPNIQLIGEYYKSTEKALFKCNKCGEIFEKTADVVVRGVRGCPKCNASTGERIVSEKLSDLKVNYIREYIFPNCRHIQPLRFDFYLPDYNVVIEYQGEQHYKPVDFTGKASDKQIQQVFELNCLRDKIKRDYCLNNNIKLIEIPYWDKENMDSYIQNAIA